MLGEKGETNIFEGIKKKKWVNKYNFLPFCGGKYSESNTLMIDGEPHTALINPVMFFNLFILTMYIT